MLAPPIEMRAELDRPRFVVDVAHNARAAGQGDRLGIDLTIDGATDQRLIGAYLAAGAAGLADDRLGTANIPIDGAIDLDLAVGHDIVGDGEIRPKQRRCGRAFLGRVGTRGLVHISL